MEQFLSQNNELVSSKLILYRYAYKQWITWSFIIHHLIATYQIHRGLVAKPPCIWKFENKLSFLFYFWATIKCSWCSMEEYLHNLCPLSHTFVIISRLLLIHMQHKCYASSLWNTLFERRERIMSKCHIHHTQGWLHTTLFSSIILEISLYLTYISQWVQMSPVSHGSMSPKTSTKNSQEYRYSWV